MEPWPVIYNLLFSRPVTAVACQKEHPPSFHLLPSPIPLHDNELIALLRLRRKPSPSSKRTSWTLENRTIEIHATMGGECRPSHCLAAKRADGPVARARRMRKAISDGCFWRPVARLAEKERERVARKEDSGGFATRTKRERRERRGAELGRLDTIVLSRREKGCRRRTPNTTPNNGRRHRERKGERGKVKPEHKE